MNGTHRAPGQRVAYLRVSSAGQNLARQLEAVGECDQTFTEKQSGKSAADRPQLQALIRHVRRGDHVVVASMDRLARSVIDLNDIVQQITGDPAEHTEQRPRKGASIEFLKERLTFEPGHADPMAAFQMNMMGAFAQFERELIRQRQAEGIAAAKKRGVYKGRPRSLESDQIRSVRNAALAGTPKAQIAREHGISRSTLYRYLAQPELLHPMLVMRISAALKFPMEEIGMPTNSRAWWHEAVVYQIYVRSFADADGDGLGDLAGVRSRLDHLESLGVDVIWLTPFYPSPMADNGYDVSDYEAVDPRFGSEGDLDDLIADIHRRGMRVIIDVVLNHTSIDHPWFVESRSTRSSSRRDWYIWRPPRDGVEPGTPGAEPTNWLGFFAQPTWTYDEESGEYYLHLFAPEQPDLNWENQEVRQALYAMLRRWLARGVDGFRLDVINLISKRYPLQDVPTPHSSHYGDASSQYTCGPRMLEFLDELRDQVFDTAEKTLLTVGEMPGATVEDGLAVTGGERPRLSMIFTFEHMDVDHAPGWGGRYEPRPFDLLALKSTMARWQEGLGRSGWNSLYFGNHDQARVASRFGSRSPAHAVASAKMLATVLHLHRGTPYVYQGDEIGMRNYPFASIEQFADIDAHNSWAYGRALGVLPERLLAGLRQNGRDNARTPMQWDASEHGGFTTGTPWLPLNPNTSEVNVEAQIDDADSVLAHYRRLIELRHSSDIVVFGDYRLLARDHEYLYAFERTLGDERWIVVANFSDEELDVAAALGGAVGAAELILGTHHEPPEGAVLQRLRPWEAQICRVLKGSEQ